MKANGKPETGSIGSKSWGLARFQCCSGGSGELLPAKRQIGALLENAKTETRSLTSFS